MAVDGRRERARESRSRRRRRGGGGARQVAPRKARFCLKHSIKRALFKTSRYLSRNISQRFDFFLNYVLQTVTMPHTKFGKDLPSR